MKGPPRNCCKRHRPWATEGQIRKPNCASEAPYLGYQLKGGKRSLSQNGIAAILQILTPKTKRQVGEFLGEGRHYHLRMPEFARPLYTSTKRGAESLLWTETKQKAFEALKTAPTSDSALTLPDVPKPLHLFVHKTKDITKEFLAQTLGPWNCPVTYLSKPN